MCRLTFTWTQAGCGNGGACVMLGCRTKGNCPMGLSFAPALAVVLGHPIHANRAVPLPRQPIHWVRGAKHLRLRLHLLHEIVLQVVLPVLLQTQHRRSGRGAGQAGMVARNTPAKSPNETKSPNEILLEAFVTLTATLARNLSVSLGEVALIAFSTSQRM